MNKTWECWKGPSCWQSSNPPQGLCCWASDQEHHPDGIRDGAVIWKCSELSLMLLCVCTSVRACHFLVVMLDAQRSIGRPQCISYICATITSGQRHNSQLSAQCLLNFPFMFHLHQHRQVGLTGIVGKVSSYQLGLQLSRRPEAERWSDAAQCCWTRQAFKLRSER